MKKKTKKKPTTYHMYVKYHHTIEGGEVSPGQEAEDWPSYEPATHEYTFLYVTKAHPSGYDYEEVEVDKKTFNSHGVYMALIKYSSGDTFSTSSGNIEILGLFNTKTRAEAHLKKRVTEEGYRPWEGYFNTLESQDVIRLDVKES